MELNSIFAYIMSFITFGAICLLKNKDRAVLYIPLLSTSMAVQLLNKVYVVTEIYHLMLDIVAISLLGLVWVFIYFIDIKDW